MRGVCKVILLKLTGVALEQAHDGDNTSAGYHDQSAHNHRLAQGIWSFGVFHLVNPLDLICSIESISIGIFININQIKIKIA